MKYLLLMTVSLLIYFGSITSAQIQLDSNGVHLGRQLFQNIVYKIAERNAFEKINISLERKLELSDMMNEYYTRRINELKRELVTALSKECEKPDWYNNFFAGFIGASLLFLIGVTIGVIL